MRDPSTNQLAEHKLPLPADTPRPPAGTNVQWREGTKLLTGLVDDFQPLPNETRIRVNIPCYIEATTFVSTQQLVVVKVGS